MMSFTSRNPSYGGEARREGKGGGEAGGELARHSTIEKVDQPRRLDLCAWAKSREQCAVEGGRGGLLNTHHTYISGYHIPRYFPENFNLQHEQFPPQPGDFFL